MRAAVAALTGFRSDQIAFQPNTSQGLMHVLFGLTGASPSRRASSLRSRSRPCVRSRPSAWSPRSGSRPTTAA
ncbi:hypothetical protein GCM10025869_21670 [Homoserinibacter gongjuensis]|uniref:Uncharacterized protein n=1 Tax=Homoserinibacter gongjuensis TaxID=1162968 RepID=A0ABQ6JW77_9MICO|nr:hypothetical protein GCM10025869_21670 [Homoserinibacter gongjuensis]